MKNDILSKKTAAGLVFIMILYVVFRLAGPLLAPFYTPSFNANTLGELRETRIWFDLMHGIVTQGFGIAVGIFLIYEAKRVNYNKALWFCLGAIFGLIALILFYIYRIYENTRPEEDR